MKRLPQVMLVAVALGVVSFYLPTVWQVEGESQVFHPSPLFDPLAGEEDVIYLTTYSSFVWGPDPNGLSEEITFTGLVTVPKWPMNGYHRRVLPDGRQQIDIELTESLLVGESYLLGGQVHLGEHPDLRSLGTITEPVMAVSRRIALAPGVHPAAAGGVQRVSFRISEEMASVIEGNPSVPWESLIVRDMRRYTDAAADIRAGALMPKATAAAANGLVELTLNLPASMARRIRDYDDVNWDMWLHETLATLVASRPDIVTDNESPIAGTVIPSDFVVARKVLLNTAKGLLYNETAVPVRGKLDSIPPVRHSTTPLGVNVFLGMELPVPLINEEGAVDGWFYSKVHTAISVRPEKIERAQMSGTIALKVGDQVEKVAVSGPAEIHHGETNGQTTPIEFVVLGLRGRSELLGGDIMIIEYFDDREASASKGEITWDSKTSGRSEFDLYMIVNTPSGKVANLEPVSVSGRLTDYAVSGAMSKGDLSIPMVGAVGEYRAAGTPRPLVSEADQVVAELVGMEFTLAKDGPHVDPATLVKHHHDDTAAEAGL